MGLRPAQGGNQGRGEPADASAEVKAKAGTLYMPAHLPEGFVLVQSFVFPDTVVNLTYRRGHEVLMIDEFASPGYPRVKRGYYHSVSVGPYPGYIVNGVWTQIIKGLADSDVRWDPGIAITLMFEQDDRWFKITASPGSAFTEEELIKIGESLRPY